MFAILKMLFNFVRMEEKVLSIKFVGQPAKIINAMLDKGIVCTTALNKLIADNAEKIKKEYNLKLK